MATSSVPQQRSHRERLIAAMAASIEEKGYRETFVGDVVRIARTSRRTYYEHFRDRDACFLCSPLLRYVAKEDLTWLTFT